MLDSFEILTTSGVVLWSRSSSKIGASVDGGSEIGTQSTRTRMNSTPTPSTQRQSVIVSGDASSGVRRSDSLHFGHAKGKVDNLAKRSSKRLSAMSTQPVHGYGSKTGSMAELSGRDAASDALPALRFEGGMVLNIEYPSCSVLTLGTV